MDMDFKVFTLNCWGIPVVARNKNTRIQAIASALATCPYDVVCLQEVWTDSDFTIIRDKVRGTLPYSHYFYSGVIGSGVCIFSRHPIVDTHFHKWMVNGYVHKLHHGDWFGGKGIGLCQIKWKGLLLNIYSAHLHAEYNRKCDEYYACRVVQAYDTAQFINFTSASADVIILAGDLNCEPGDLTYRFMVEMTSLKDAFKEQNDGTKGPTNLDLQNTYTPKSLKENAIDGPRIDYVLYKGCHNTQVNLVQYKQPFPERIPTMSISFSDHEAITATLNISKSEVFVDNKAIPTKFNESMLLEGVAVMERGLDNIVKHKIWYWIITILLLAVIIGSYFYVPEFEALLHCLRILMTVVMCYTFIMATLWNMIETNTLYATKLAMQINLKTIELEHST